MKLLVITPETPRPFEADAIMSMLDTGVWRAHIRHPLMSEADVKALITRISPEYRSRISLHDHAFLASEEGLGIHLNRRNSLIPIGFTGSLSRSFHSIAEREAVESNCQPRQMDYYMISPIFDSISKAGYVSNFTDREIVDAFKLGLLDEGAVALGGVKASNIGLLRRFGFQKVAVLGSAWRGRTIDDINNNVKELLDVCCNS